MTPKRDPIQPPILFTTKSEWKTLWKGPAATAGLGRRTPEVRSYLSRLPAPKRRIAVILRDIVLSANKTVSASVKRNYVAFKAGKDHVCFIYTYAKADYMSLGFMHATDLTDPDRLFQGTGKGMRHIKVRTPKDVPAVQIRKWVREAVKLLDSPL